MFSWCRRLQYFDVCSNTFGASLVLPNTCAGHYEGQYIFDRNSPTATAGMGNLRPTDQVQPVWTFDMVRIRIIVT